MTDDRARARAIASAWPDNEVLARAITAVLTIVRAEGRAEGIEAAAKVVDKWSLVKTEYGYWHGWKEACDNGAAEIRALIAAPLETGWRPIESAPKDGTPIIYYDKRKCVGEAFWMDKDEYEPAWWDEASTETVYPAYWMPFDPPKGDA